MAYTIHREDWADDPEHWRGELQGAPHGANISVVFSLLPEPGDGPRLYRHPYPETFIIRSGEALFTVGDDVISAAGGQIVVVPLNTPHKFTKPVRLRWRRSTSMKAAHSSPNGWSKRFCGGMIVNRSIARK
jgi:hypothetical protein